MIEIRYKQWVFEADPLKTKEIYQSITRSGAQNCGCDDCKNYLKQKERAFPDEIKELFEKLEIDFRKEAGVSYLDRRDDGYYQYHGWFHFIGKIAKGRKPKRLL